MAIDDSTASQDRIMLNGHEALALWRKGKDPWNLWVEENPVAGVDFSNINFGK
jgi:hypothetical protein